MYYTRMLHLDRANKTISIESIFFLSPSVRFSRSPTSAAQPWRIAYCAGTILSNRGTCYDLYFSERMWSAVELRGGGEIRRDGIPLLFGSYVFRPPPLYLCCLQRCMPTKTLLFKTMYGRVAHIGPLGTLSVLFWQSVEKKKKCSNCVKMFHNVMSYKLQAILPRLFWPPKGISLFFYSYTLIINYNNSPSMIFSSMLCK